ncbi:32804_t:CDS:2, partial [Racocetra persica]
WHFWFYKSLKYEDVQTKDNNSINLFPLRVFFLTLFLSIIQVFFAYAYICSLPIIDSLFNFLVGMVLSRAVAAFFSNQRVIHNYIMEVDDESNCFRVIDYEENIEKEAQDLKYDYKLPIRILAFFLFMNFTDGYYTWKQSLVGYVNRKQRYFTSKYSSFKIKCRKIKYIKKDQKDPISSHNKTLNIVEDEIKINQKDKLIDLETLNIEGDDEIKINQKDKLIDLETLNIEGDDEIDLYRKGRIYNNNWDYWDYWEARLSIKDNEIKLIQQLRFGSKKATDFKSINGRIKMSIKSPDVIKFSDDIKASNDNNGDVKILIKKDDNIKSEDDYIKSEDDYIKSEDDYIKSEDDYITDKDISILIEEGDKLKLRKAKDNENINLDGDWKLKIKNGEIFLVNKRVLECKAQNNKGKNTIHLYRVNLNGSWFKDSTNELKYKQKYDHYKTIEIDAEEGISNDLKIEDKPFKYATKSTDYWSAILKKENDKFFLRYEVPPDENVIRLSVEGNKLINLKYYDDIKRFTNNEDIKRFTNNEDIIKFTYDKMVYEEDLTESFKSLTINHECQVKRDKCEDKTAFIISFRNDTLYEKFKGRFCHKDELTVSSGNDEIKFVRQHSFLKHLQRDKFAIEQDDKTGTIIIRIQVLDNEEDDDTKEKGDPIVTRLDHGGELKIQINRNDQNIGKNGVKI